MKIDQKLSTCMGRPGQGIQRSRTGSESIRNAMISSYTPQVEDVYPITSMLSSRMPLSNSPHIQCDHRVALPIMPQDRSETTALRGLHCSQFTLVHHELSPSQKAERVEPLLTLTKCFNPPNIGPGAIF
jgi:hypothetical protein